MGRAPCCDKANVKKGPWSPEEDAKLKSYIEQHGTGGNWIALPQKIGLKRCGKSCRLRWLNYLRPNIKHGGFSEEEDSIICSLYISIGSRWSIIAAQLPGRTDNDIKNYWNTRLKKKLLGKQRKEKQSGKGSALKQEMKRGNHINSMAAIETNNNNHHHHNPYWPELPVLAPIPYSNQVPRLHDHTSIRKLLIKLGGRFSDDDHLVPNVPNPQFSNGFISSSTNHDFYEQSSVGTSSASMEALDTGTNNGAQFALSTPYEVNGGEAGLQVLQGQSNYPYALEEMAISNPERLDGLEFLLGDGMAFDTKRIEQSNGEGVNVGALREMSSLVYPTAASSCGGIHQQTLYQEYAFDELRYPGSV